MQNKDHAAFKESVTVEETAKYPSIAHHVERLTAEAKAANKPQRFVLSSGVHDEGSGETVLAVKADGGHKVEFVPGE
jgi:hypothetical protein